MNTAVQFHDAAVLRAAKVRNVGTHRVLPTELETLQPETPKQVTTPLARLRFGRGEVRALYRSVPPCVPGYASGDRDVKHSRFDPLTRPAPAGESAGCGPPSPPRGRGLRSWIVRFENVQTPVPRPAGRGLKDVATAVASNKAISIRLTLMGRWPGVHYFAPLGLQFSLPPPVSSTKCGTRSALGERGDRKAEGAPRSACSGGEWSIRGRRIHGSGACGTLDFDGALNVASFMLDKPDSRVILA